MRTTMCPCCSGIGTVAADDAQGQLWLEPVACTNCLGRGRTLGLVIDAINKLTGRSASRTVTLRDPPLERVYDEDGVGSFEWCIDLNGLVHELLQELCDEPERFVVVRDGRCVAPNSFFRTIWLDPDEVGYTRADAVWAAGDKLIEAHVCWRTSRTEQGWRVEFAPVRSEQELLLDLNTLAAHNGLTITIPIEQRGMRVLLHDDEGALAYEGEAVRDLVPALQNAWLDLAPRPRKRKIEPPS